MDQYNQYVDMSIKKIHEFIDSRSKNTWISVYDDEENLQLDISLYLRKSFRILPSAPNQLFEKDNSYIIAIKEAYSIHAYRFKDKFLPTLDIANIRVYPEGKGIGTKIINRIHFLNPYCATYIENVHNEYLWEHLIENFWIRENDSWSRSFFKLVEEKQ